MTVIWIMVVVAAIAGIAGVMAGNWLTNRRAVSEKGRQVDEFLGLGERTGLTGDLDLLATPLNLTIHPGEPIKVKLTLINKTTAPMTLNGWLTPAPADFRSNQLPFKVAVHQNNRKVRYIGDPILFPPHKKKDFFTLLPKETKVISPDLSLGAGGGKWNLSTHGVYTFEVWYETYLTGRYVGVHAWTGMTNHVVVHVTVVPWEGSTR